MTTGAQAEVYADHFIANHLKAIGGGKTYAQLSAQSLAAAHEHRARGPGRRPCSRARPCAACCSTPTPSARWASCGIAAIAAFIAALVMLILGGLGLMHARRTSPATDILSGHPGPAPAPGTAPQQTTHSSGNGLPATVPGNSAGPSV